MTQKNQSVYAKIAEDLIEKIVSGEYRLGTLLPPERVLKEHYRVERTTVRRGLELLSRDGYIEKRAGLGSVVVSKVAKGGSESNSETSPNEKKSAYDAPKKSGLSILALLPKNGDKGNSFVDEILKSLRSVCKKNGDRLTVLSSDDAGEAASAISENSINACVIFSEENEAVIELLRAKKIPVCFALCRRSGFHCVLPDTEEGCEAAAERLIGGGHESVAFIGSDEEVYLHHEYRNRFSDKISRVCSDADIKKLTNTGGSDEKSGFERLSELIRRAGGSFSAVVAINDEVAEGALKAAHYYRISVPEELSIISLLSCKKDGEVDRIYTDPECIAEEIYGFFLFPSDKRGDTVSLCHAAPICGKTTAAAKKQADKEKRLSDFLL